MKPLPAPEIQGTWATLLLPVAPGDAIDFARLSEELDYLVAAPVDGIYSNGTAGEFYTETEAEFDAIHSLMADKCNAHGKPFQIGVSHTSAQISLERLRRAVAWQPSAIQVVLPDWFPVTLSEAAAFLERMAEAAAPIGLVLYNPPHAKLVLSPRQFQALAPYLVGVKVADGDAEWYRAMKASAPAISLFVPGHRLATGLANGAHGAYSNVACLHPAGAKQWNRLMHTDPAAARELEARIRQFMEEHIVPFRAPQGFANAALDKLLAAIGGWCDIGTRLRWPYRWIPMSEARRLRPAARRILPELFAAE